MSITIFNTVEQEHEKQYESILKQPNGLYCVWSKILNTPIKYNLTKEELYERDYISLSYPLWGILLKNEVDRILKDNLLLEEQERIVSYINKKELEKFLIDIGSKYTVKDFKIKRSKRYER